MPKYIPFLRVSTKQQDTDRQLADITKYATTHGLTLVAPISEIISGGKKNEVRAGVQQVLKTARRGDTIIATEISRIGRNASQVMQFLEELADRGVSVRVLNAGLATLRADGSRDPMAWAMLGVGVIFADLERSTIRERVQSGVDYARSQGRIGGRPAGSTKGTQQLLSSYPGVVKRLLDGQSVRDVAKLTDTSARTVGKVRQLLAGLDDEQVGLAGLDRTKLLTLRETSRKPPK